MGTRKVSFALWIAAFVVTVALAVFQRATGPSYPLRGTTTLENGEALKFHLVRSNQGQETLAVRIPEPSGGLSAILEWRRFPTGDSYQTIPMDTDNAGSLEAVIPHQPAAGKVEYFIRLLGGSQEIRIPEAETVVARFRASVPAYVLIPHILAMFLSMLLSTRALLEVIRPGAPRGRGLILISMGLLVLGGLMLGPLVQKFAFDAYWTGWPNGTDLTDNKTLIAFIAWLPAAVVAARGLQTRLAVVVGWIVMMGVFLIPHSMRGSELDWSEVDDTPAKVERTAETG